MRLNSTKIFTLAASLFASVSIAQQTAEIQVIHNSPDPGAAAVDIFLGPQEVLSNVTYRQASEFLTVPAGMEVQVGIAAASETNSATDILFTFPFTLADGEKYYVIADGMIGSTFDLFASPGARTEATSATGNTDFIIYHGSLDAPAVDIFVEEAAGNVAEDLAWTQFSLPVEVGNSDYNVQVRNDASTATVAAYEATLATLGLVDQALLVMASGYLASSPGQPEFALLAVLTDGTVAELPTAFARAQIIHNSPVAGMVDVWVNNAPALESVNYREASEFIDLPVGLGQQISITGAGAGDTSGAAIQATLDLLGMGSYYVIADGDGINQSLGLRVATGAREEAASGPGNSDFQIYHGSVDAPSVDVYVEEATTNVGEDLVFGAFSDYVEVANADYNVQIRDENSTVTVASFEAPLASLGLEDAALIVVASGYLTPATMADPSFTLLAILADGTVAELEAATARALIIHDSEAAGIVDIWVNNELALQDVDFRQSSGFINLPVGLGQTVAITGANAMDTSGAAIQASFDFEGQHTYIIVADGDIANQPLNLNVVTGGKEVADDSDETAVLVYHGSVNAPTVDIVETGIGAGTIVEDLVFGEFDGYLDLETVDYELEVRDETGAITVATYTAPLESLNLDGESIVVVASGYLNPTGDQQAFGLYVALANGGDLIPLPSVVSSTNELSTSDFLVSPNPTSNYIVVQSEIALADSYIIRSTAGQELASGQIKDNGTIDMNDLKSGIYYVQLNSDKGFTTVKVYKN